MSIFRDFEKKLENLFEGVFVRAFKSGVQPVEVGKKLVRELETHKAIGVRRIYVPNRYEVGLAPKDYTRFETYQGVLSTELENLLISYIKEKGYVVLDRPRVKLEMTSELKEGEFWIKCHIEGEIPPETPEQLKEQAPPPEVRLGPAVLELQDSGDVAPVFELGEESVQLGRISNNDIVLPDPNVSRVHARISKRGDSYWISDLQSTNGTWVNEQRVMEARLDEDDVIRLGTTKMIFRRAED